MIDVRTPTLSAALAGTLAVVPAAMLHADQATMVGDAPIVVAQDAAAGVDPQTLDRFVDAFIEVQNIRQQFATELQQVASESDAQKLREQAQNEMIDVVQEQGITVDEYNEVATRMQNDPELLQLVQEMAAERM